MDIARRKQGGPEMKIPYHLTGILSALIITLSVIGLITRQL
jgi:hypothetical protein